ncbi:MAG TPA: gamma carbonic anhydrase family protein [Thermoanaerobaculia bacterium]|jgi:carbonic anhydrase/acetyltransferase-like protein (isoleucine patch superfamily)
MIVRSYEGKQPRFGERVFVAENAAVIGDVQIGDDCSIWYSATVRGDVNRIRIGARSNIQDNCALHVTNDTWPIEIAEEVTIGHGVVAHGCTIERRALIGMGSRVLDGAIVGELALVGAGALVPEGMRVPPRTLVIGVPARVKRELTGEEIALLEQSWKNYVGYKDRYLAAS